MQFSKKQVVFRAEGQKVAVYSKTNFYFV
jgi:hypothetical protein